MTPPNVKRNLRCPKGHAWLIDVGDSEWCPICDHLGEPFCACGCGASLADLRSDAVYRSEACAKRLQRRARPDIDPTGHPLEDARGQMREGRTSAQWEWVAREKARTLLESGEFTADDLADLNVPVHYRRHVHGAATGYWSGELGCMDSVGLRKSRRPSRKGGKNELFQINAKGRRELPRLLRDLQSELPRLVGSSSSASGGSHLAAGSGEDPGVGPTLSEKLGTPPPMGADADAGSPGNCTVTGQSRGKSDQGRLSESASPAAGDGADLLSLGAEKPKPRNAIFDDWETAA